MLVCDNNLAGTISPAMERALRSLGFSVSDNNREATYICKVIIDENLMEMPGGTFYKPALQVTLESRNKKVFTYSSTLERVGAVDAALARRRMENDLVTNITEKFVKELRERVE
jgi:hypothetical protein